MSTPATVGARLHTRLSSGALQAIREHGTATFPDECCGAMIEVGGLIVDAFRLENTTETNALRRFRIGPGDYRLAEARARELNGTLAGFYHSHPNHPATPSQHDLAAAWPNFSYVIISVNAGVPGDITCWYLKDDRSAFEQGELTWDTES
jgi:proteasome lid subunit RPN8/RPN11